MTLTDIDRLTKQNANPRSIKMWKALQPLRSCLSFMNTGAHPDDETTTMLAALGLRDGIRLSQACANRGEGGQNAIGSEITRDLGVVRTCEMERAAEVINMSHYWLSETPEDTIFDFGFSKSGSETLEKWGEQRTLERFVLIIRRERPDIVCPTFLDISGQHGHHQAMTRSAFKAVLLAADPAAFPEQNLPIWQVKKVYLPAWSGAGDAYDDDAPPPPETVCVNSTGADPILGIDYAQIAQYSRSFHRTQGMGKWIEPGLPSVWPLNLAWSCDGVETHEKSIYDHLPMTLFELSEYAKCAELDTTLCKAQTALNQAISAWPDYTSIHKYLITALQNIAVAITNCPDTSSAEVLHRLSDKQRQISNALAIAKNINCRVTLSQYEARPGESLELTTHLNTPDCNVTAHVNLPDRWTVEKSENNTHKISIPSDEEPSDPYPDTWYPDRANAPLNVVLEWYEGDHLVSISIDPEERLHVLPTFSAALSQTDAVLNLANPVNIKVSLTQIYPKDSNCEFSSMQGWQISQNDNHFKLQPSTGLTEGMYTFNLLLDKNPTQSINRMNYSHIGTANRCVSSGVNVQVVNVALPEGRIAYIGGGNDRTDFWLRKLGVDVESLTSEMVQNVELSEYDSILIGIFAFQTCPMLNSRLKDLHDWVLAGGNLVTLYHRPWDNWDPESTALAYLKIGKPSLRWRVTDENANVLHLEPNNQLLNTPNKITKSDWDKWDKERGLYFAERWDEAYTPILEISDTNESPLRGALLTGKFGKGRHTHTSLILHHQVEKLVPGGFRILANLLHNPV